MQATTSNVTMIKYTEMQKRNIRQLLLRVLQLLRLRLQAPLLRWYYERVPRWLSG